MRPITPPSQPADYLPLFQKLLPSSVLASVVQAGEGRFYQRIYTPLVLLWGFVYQRLELNGSCNSVLDHLSSGALDELDQAMRSPRQPTKALSKRISLNNSAYCQGRRRLPREVLETALRHTASTIQNEMGKKGLCKGHRVILLDGNTLQLQATTALIEHYGQPRNQNGSSHWPSLRMVAAFDLNSAAVIDCEEGPLVESEQQLTLRLLPRLGAQDHACHFNQKTPGIVCIADANFGVFSVVRGIQQNGGKALVRLTPARYEALLRRLKLQPLQTGQERKITWTPSAQDQVTADSQPVEGRLLYVRLEKDGFEPKHLYLFTTLGEDFTSQELVELYGQRWHNELCLRYIKSELQLEHLVSRSVEMVRKELLAGLIAYNLIRGFMVLAANQAHISPLTLSFKRCWHCIMIFGMSCTAPGTPEQIANKMDNLFRRLAGQRIQKRKPRSHPRSLRLQRRKYPVFKGSRNNQPIHERNQW